MIEALALIIILAVALLGAGGGGGITGLTGDPDVPFEDES